MKHHEPENLVGRLQATLSALLQSAPNVQGIVIALSGGMDSMVLLDLCARLQRHLSDSRSQAQQSDWQLSLPRPVHWRAIHINHGLHPDADDWQRHCELACEQRSMPCQSFSLNLRETLSSASTTAFASATENQQIRANEGLESLARTARYQTIADAMAPGEVLLTAHHAQDQGETVLFRLLRGAGPRGLGGMREVAVLPVASGNGPEAGLWRPLLRESPKSLQSYARQAQLSWIEDSSNQDIAFNRNYLRHRIIPLIDERWPGWLSAIEKSASACRESDALLQSLAHQWLKGCQGKQPGQLSVKALSGHSRAERDVILRQWLWERGGQWAGQTLLGQLSALLEAAEDRQPQLAWQGHTIRRYRDELMLTSPLPALPEWPAQGYAWQLGSVATPADRSQRGSLPTVTASVDLPLPNNGRLYLESVPESAVSAGLRWPEAACRVRYRQEGVKARLPGRPAKSLKQLWQEAGVPPWLRDRAPLLYVGNELAWIAGVGVCEGFIAKEGEPGWLPGWQAPDGEVLASASGEADSTDAKMRQQRQS